MLLPGASFDMDSKDFMPSHRDILDLKTSFTNYSKSDLVHLRKQLLTELNGDTFFKLNQWPREMKIMLFNKPIGDRNTFKLMCFLLGNGCPPLLAIKWIMSSQHWCGKLTTSAEKSDLFRERNGRTGAIFSSCAEL